MAMGLLRGRHAIRNRPRPRYRWLKGAEPLYLNRSENRARYRARARARVLSQAGKSWLLIPRESQWTEVT
jgi:hypothetical protein